MPHSCEAHVSLGLTYQWVDWDAGSARSDRSDAEPAKHQRYLVGQQIRPIEIYDPISSDPALYTALANLQMAEPEIKEFANVHGDFGIRGLGGLDGAPGPTFKELRDEIDRYQVVFQRWQKSGEAQDAAIVELNRHAKAVLHRHNLRYVLSVDGLIPAAWLQLAMAMDENRQIGSCLHCGRVFEMNRQGPRKQYCDYRCKKRYQRRNNP